MIEHLHSQPLLNTGENSNQVIKRPNIKKYIYNALCTVVGLILGVLIGYLSFGKSRHLKEQLLSKTKSANLVQITEISDELISRERLSRSFYLSKSAYTGDFSSFYDNINNKSIKFKSGELIKMKKKNLKNGFFKPVWYVGVHERDMYVVVRGTASIYDWISDGTIPNYYNGQQSFHLGFLIAANNIWKNIDILFYYYKRLGYNIIFTGHSYGGAVAQILHYHASIIYKERTYSYVFGAATPMGEKQANRIKNASYSFVFRDDIVPRLMNFVTDYQAKKINELVNNILSPFDMNAFGQSGFWKSTGKENISNPIGTVYHLSLQGNNLKTESVSNAKISNFDGFYDYNVASILNAIKDHDLIMYYNNLLYNDGLIPPQDF